MMSLKYVHVVQKISNEMKSALEEVPRRGGMYNWMFLFKGSIMQMNDVTKEELERFDVVQVNLSPVDQLMVPRIKNMLNNSSTLLIGNNDYVVETWDTHDQHPLQYLQYQDMCDAVFGTEEFQTSFLRDDAYIIPHPHWTGMLGKIGIDDMRENRVAALYHWWEAKSYTTSLIFEKLRRTHPQIKTRLYSYMATPKDRSARWNKAMFDKTMPLFNYPDFMTSLGSNKFVFEPCSYHTYGRTSVDAAAIGIPMVGSNRVDSMRRCFPGLSSEPYDCKAILHSMELVMKNGSYLDRAMDYAKDAVEYYNYKNAEIRYMNMVNETRERLRK